MTFSRTERAALIAAASARGEALVLKSNDSSALLRGGIGACRAERHQGSSPVCQWKQQIQGWRCTALYPFSSSSLGWEASHWTWSVLQVTDCCSPIVYFCTTYRKNTTGKQFSTHTKVVLKDHQIHRCPAVSRPHLLDAHCWTADWGHRTIELSELDRILKGHLVQTPATNRGTYNSISAQTPIQPGLGCLQGHLLPLRAACAVLPHPCCKQLLLQIQSTSPLFLFETVPPCSATKCLSPPFLQPLQMLAGCSQLLQGLLFCQVSSLSPPSLSV